MKNKKRGLWSSAKQAVTVFAVSAVLGVATVAEAFASLIFYDFNAPCVSLFLDGCGLIRQAQTPTATGYGRTFLLV